MNYVKFCDCQCIPVRMSYDNDRLAIQLVDREDGSLVAKATLNVPEISVGPDEAVIKNYSENEGMLEALQEAGLVLAIVGWAQSRFVTCPIVKIDVSKLH